MHIILLSYQHPPPPTHLKRKFTNDNYRGFAWVFICIVFVAAMNQVTAFIVFLAA
jgi:hypothetical protein